MFTDIAQAQPNGLVHYWPGCNKLHHVPFGFKWPSFTVNIMWNLWHFGDHSNQIGAYKFISPGADLTEYLCRVNRSRTSKVVRRIMHHAVEGGKLNTAAALTRDNSQSIYDYAYLKLIEELYPEGQHPPRPQDINIYTISNRMTKRRIIN